ncbi:STT3 domain-containing protein [uncultured Helicobacter sp.]|uniref:STT3 domain-containing protein n=1 Tax=uncultured Helicobacter sp. TaxID=175537 RepID=UPI00261507CD|nr:STT3 domain-containing protein [uncultured Helicobacter sp.]
MHIQRDILASICIYLICVALRFYYPFILESFPQYFLDNAWLLNTHDAYFYAQGAKDVLNALDGFLDSNFLFTKSTLNSPTHEPLSIITACVAFFTPLSLEQVFFYLPGFFGTLIVFPMFYIARNFGIIQASLASLLSAISVSYFNRTIFGYYDTDMLILPLVLSVIALILSNTSRTFLFALSVFALLYYPNLRYVFLGFIVILCFFKDKKEAMLILMLSLVCVLYIRFFPLWILLAISLFKTQIHTKFFIFTTCSCALLILYALMPNLLNSPFLNTLLPSFIESKPAQSLPFLNVLDSIAETSKISFFDLAKRISGTLPLFILGLIGYGYLVYQRRIFLLFLPLLLLGFFSLLQGLRFSFYATPVLALGLSYLLFCLRKKIPSLRIFVVFFIALVVYPHFFHIANYTPKPILDSTEAKTLKEIPTKSGDYALAWWDYGYMINYFSNLNVFIDGGKHSGKENYPISQFLASSDPILSYDIAKSLLNNTQQTLFIILPLSMLEIFPSVVRFSNFNPPKFFALSKKIESKIAYFNHNITLDLKNGILNPNQQKISKFISLKTQTTLHFNPKSTLSALELKDDRILLCDNSYLKSFYFQGLFFDTLERNFFQKVLKNDKIAIYKLL